MTDASPREAGLAPGLLPSRAALLAWAGAWLSGLALLILDTRDPYVRSHAAHAVVLLGGLMAVAIGLWALAILAAFVSPGLFRVLAWMATGAWLVFGLAWAFGMVQTLRRRMIRLPGVSRLAARLADRFSQDSAPDRPRS